jgi:hypothetical protein
MANRILRSWVMVGCGSLLALAACNEVLGIEPAKVDPRLTKGSNASGSSNAGSGFVAGGSGPQGGSSSASGGALAGGSGRGGSSGQEHDAGAAGTPSADGGEAGATVGTGGSSVTSSGGSGSHSGQGTTGGSSSDDAGSAGETPTGPVDPCDEYCGLMDDECKGDAAQYRDQEQCLRICHLLPPGTVDGPDENSVACRLKYARKTHYGNGSEVTDYCHKAGPSGDGKCGNACDGFCTLMGTVCTEESAGIYHFQSDQDCLTTCNGLPPATIAYSSSDPLVSDGNHALCRLFHVTSAAMADADEHCEHAMGVTLCQAPGM